MIQYRRFATLLLGAWLAVSVAMDFIAMENYTAVDRFLHTPSVPALEQIHALGHDSTRLLMRHFAGEQNRWYFEQWERAQVALGLALILLLIFGSKPPVVPIGLCLLMLIIVLVDRFGITPQATRLGRIADYVPPSLPSVDRRTFYMLQNSYTALEATKVALGLVAAVILLIRRKNDPMMFARESESAKLPMPRRSVKRS